MEFNGMYVTWKQKKGLNGTGETTSKKWGENMELVMKGKKSIIYKKFMKMVQYVYHSIQDSESIMVEETERM